MAKKDGKGLPPGSGKKKSGEEEELEMLSPPYPLDGDTVDVIHRRLLQLQDWLNHYRVASNNYKGKEDCIPPARPVPDLEAHRRLSMARLHGLVEQMRKLRQGWDYLVCLYEESWDSGKSQDERHSLLHFGHFIVDGAYLSEEMLEARNDTLQRQCMQAVAGQVGRFFMHMQLDPYHEEHEEEHEGEGDEPTAG